MSTTDSLHRTTATHVRLTRRGRALLLGALVAVLFGAFSLGRSVTEAASTATPARPSVAAVALEETTVQPGESLWTLARRIAPGNDPRAVVAQIRRLNDLSTSQVRPGQLLLLPVAA